MGGRNNFVVCPVCQNSHVAFEAQRANAVLATTCQNCGHFFKFRVAAPFKSSVSFTVNGKATTVENEFSASASLNDYLRQSGTSVGTKVYCKQGGCGVCIVVAKMQLNPDEGPVTANINSCLCPLYMVDGWEITTIEGLGSTKTTMNTIQSTLSTYGGTQCGYCSTGHVMNMHGLMEKYPNLNKQMVEDHFEGNLCRCTGYRPILDAMKSLVPADTSDIEDLSKRLCKTTGKMCATNGNCSSNGRCNNKPAIKPQGIQMVFADARWMKPTTVTELQTMLTQTAGEKVRIMGANTGTGYFTEESLDNYDVAIDISGIPDLYVNTYDDATQTFTVGACVSLSDLLDIFIAEAAKAGDNGNFNELKKYLYRVASSPIRNRGTWAGNLMLKNKHPSFPSDVFNIFTVLGATLYIGDGTWDTVTVDQFFKTDMTGKILSKATFLAFGADDVVAAFKVMPRAQNSLALVNGTFRCGVDKANNYTVTTQPIISIGGISDTFHRATQTETYLLGKELSDPATMSGAMAALEAELEPSDDVRLPSMQYRKSVACSLLYKFILKALGTDAASNYWTATDVLHDVRPLSSGIQTYDTNKQEWPLNEPLKKLEADVQCTGEAVYVDDFPDHKGQLYGAFVLSTVANATIQTINTDEAMKLTGVVKCFTVQDLPDGATNDVRGPTSSTGNPEAEELFCSGKVLYYGQSIAFVVAETAAVAEKAAKLVEVTYNSQEAPILTIEDAIAAQSFYPKPADVKIVGDPDAALASAPHTLSGVFHTGEQIHFHLETQASNVVPNEDGLDIASTTQWTDSIQQAVGRVTTLDKNRINVSVKRLGGGFGGKISRNNIVAAACGLAARLLDRPVRARLPIQTNLELLGRRFPHRAEWQVGFGDDGTLQAILLKIYEGLGCLPNEDHITYLQLFIDNAYHCPNWKLDLNNLRTNLPMGTSCRAPSSTPAVQIMENIMESIARSLGMDPNVVKTNNFYTQGQMTPFGMPLEHCNIDLVMNELMTSAEVNTRQELFKFYNQDNRWKKKALAVVPMKMGLTWAWEFFTIVVGIYHPDGSVAITHGGVEMGQSLNTKVAQVLAYQLGVPVNMISVKPTNTTVNPNNNTTGGSTTSESCSLGAIECCKQLNERLAPVREKMPEGYTWAELIEKAYGERVVLTATYTNIGQTPRDGWPDIFRYNSYGATCSEVELDVLTGEYQINRVDILYDCGESLNPAVDVGQCEGAFIMGLGLNTTESVKYDPTTGQMLSRDTWDYHAPTNKDIPVDFRVSLLKNAPNPSGVLRSKASGEPPLTMSCSVLFALRKCIVEARKDAGNTDEFNFDPPATVEYIQQACLVDTSQFLTQ